MNNNRSNSNVIGRKKEYFQKRYDTQYGMYALLNKSAIIRYHHTTAAKLLSLVLLNKNPNSILDIGCAAGDFSARLKSEYSDARVIGMDFVQKGLDIAQERYPYLQLIKGKLPKIPLGDQSMEIICCMEILYYLDEEGLEKSIREIDRVLSHGGVVLASTTLDDGRNYFTEAQFIEIFKPKFQLVDIVHEPCKLAGQINLVFRKMREWILRLPKIGPLNSMVVKFCDRINGSNKIVQVGIIIGNIIYGKRAITKAVFVFKREIEVK